MLLLDNDSAIRDRAYALWESAGRPVGDEHKHWAQALREIREEATVFSSISERTATVEIVSARKNGSPETARLRQALYTPEPFSFDLFGSECPSIDRSIIVQRPVVATPRSPASDHQAAA